MSEAVAKSASRSRRKQADRSSAAIAKLVAATTELIADRGVSNFSIVEVADRAGVSRGLPSHHFKSREGLLKAVAQKLLAIPGAPRSYGLEPLLDGFAAVLTGARRPTAERRALLALMLAPGSDAPFHDETQAYWRELCRQAEAHLVAGMGAGEVRNLEDVAPVAASLVGALYGQMIVALNGPQGAMSDDQAEAFLAIVRNALARAERLEPAPGPRKKGASGGGVAGRVGQGDLFG